MTEITEWQFTADIASQINEILRDNPDLPFSNAQCEERGRGQTKRRDLTLYNRAKKIVLTGEVKLPDKRDGKSPLNEAVVRDASNKANEIGVKHFFTWNVNNCVFWNTFEEGKSLTERHVEFFDALPSPIYRSDELLNPRIKEQLSKFLLHFLQRSAALLSGEKPLQLLPLDTKFVKVWELALNPLVRETLFAINSRYSNDRHFRVKLERWMVEQGWTISQKDEVIIRENLERAAKFSCYILANKIIFYIALRRQFSKLKALEIKTSVKTNEELTALLEDAFKHATVITRDYETVFQSDFGDSLPLLHEYSVESWRDLLADADKFDFTRLNYEVIGQIFENLLDVEERHKFGQHYTRSEVVDLINAFCIRDADAKVLDPSCGGGTFLVRAYQRKNDLADGGLSHQQLISQIYGTDISTYPVHLTTINLATRDLKEGANYPLIARRDFLRTKLNQKIFHVPSDDGESQQPLTKVDAVVGNPPYVRQEKINEYYGKEYKKFLQKTVEEDALNTELSGRSDILCYFFTHSFSLLNDGGYIGLLTSSNWLDTAYGFQLQKFLLNNFEIIAILESNCEPWFTGARVTTAATILRKQPNIEKRNANNVKFVSLSKPIGEFVSYSKGNEGVRRATFEDIRDRIEKLTEEEENNVWRIRVVNQSDLYNAGCLDFTLADEDDESEDSEQKSSVIETSESRHLPNTVTHSEYTGSKWGIFLRAPEIFTKLLRQCNEKLVPLGNVAEVRFGVKTGCDTFFFPIDVTDTVLAENLTDAEFQERFRITKKQTSKIRIVHAGDGSQHLIETEFLEPEIHSLMELDSITININSLRKKILLVSAEREALQNKEVLKYINWGEKEKFHERITVANRVSSERSWYDLTGEKRSQIIFPKIQQYRHIISLNSKELLNNSSLLSVITPRSTSEILCAILNSTFVALSKQFFGRLHGREGSLQLDVYSAQMMLIPNPHEASSEVAKRLLSSFGSMRNRKALPMVDVDSTIEDEWTGELAFADRQVLDDAVLELLGIKDKKERCLLRDELYHEITELYRGIRVAEKKMQRFRAESSRRSKNTPQSIAEEIWSEMEPKPHFFSPLNFVTRKEKSESFSLPEGKAKIIEHGLLGQFDVKIGEKYLEVENVERANFIKTLADIGLTGDIEVPISAEACQRALILYEKEFTTLDERFKSEVATFTSEEHLQERAVRELWKKLRS